MGDSFANRMDAQRAILKEINRVAWPTEELFALSELAIQRWVSANRLALDDEVVKLAREAGDALLFLANASQEQVSPEYASRSANVAVILRRLRFAVRELMSVG
jgi:hypothetical protein